ncbi:MAG: hypothetical protein KGI25_09880 [Thaumarchaeota archaeon]|nr:hypothetical protein [Nitrososphaerota archaeon]
MPKDESLKKILVLGSGAIKIGEAGESHSVTANSTTPVLNASRQSRKRESRAFL